jgi:hypothetical protein
VSAWLIVLVTGALGCSEPEPNAPFLWVDVALDDAVDLGHDAQPIPEQEQRAPGLLMLEEIGEDVGLADAVGGGNQHGVGVGFVDVDGDGDEDLFIANGRQEGTDNRFPSQLFLDEAGVFVDASAASGIDDILAGKDCYSVAAADFDTDGDMDLYVTTHPRDVLLVNDGTGVFSDGTAGAGAGGPPSSEEAASNGSSKIASWGDFDRDGLIDVVVASATFDAQPANGYLLRNRGDGTFEDITGASGLQVSRTGNPCAVLWSDYDNDGDQDLWVWNDRGDDEENRVLLRNEGGERFTDVTEDADLDVEVPHPMGIDAADINHDGHLDYYLGDIGTNPLFLSNGNGTFVDIQEQAGVGGDFGWGLGFEDFNADGWPDIFVAQEDELEHLTFTHRGDPDAEIIFEGARWPHAPTNGARAHNVAVAFADFDRDGRVDIVTATTDGSRAQLYRNATDPGTARWLEVRVAAAPGTGERGGVSARVVVKTGDLLQFRDINGGSSRASQNATSARFGLGQWTGAEWVAAVWPDGRQLVVTGVEGNRVLELAPP